MADSRIIFKLNTFLLGNAVMLAHSGKQFGLFYRINTQVGFHIQVQVQHVFGVTGFFSYHRHNFFAHLGRVQLAGGRFGRGGRCRYRRGLSRRGRGYRSRLGHRGRRLRSRCCRLSGRSRRTFTAGIGNGVFNNGANGLVIFKLYAFLAGNVVRLAHDGKQFSLFYRINTQIGFHIQVQVQHILRITGLFSNDV